MESLSSKLKRKYDKSLRGGEAPAKRRGIIKVEERRERCDFDFYNCPCEELAKKLLGCLLVSRSGEGGGGEGGGEDGEGGGGEDGEGGGGEDGGEGGGGEDGGEDGGGEDGGGEDGGGTEESGEVAGKERWKCWGRIVETEAYLGSEDKASHSYNGKVTQRNKAMYMPPGTAYVFSIYGMHCCFNISSRGSGAAVLIRALEPLGGRERMKKCRKVARKERDLCNGPAKLCQALGIDKTINRLDLTCSQRLWVEFPMSGGAGDGRHGDVVSGSDIGVSSEIVKSARVGVAYAGEEWAGKLLRFYKRDSQYVSK